MNKISNYLLIILIAVVIAFGSYLIIYEIDTEKPVTTEKTAEEQGTDYETVFLRDQEHAVYLTVPREWNTENTYYEIDSRVTIMRFDLGCVDEYGLPVGDAIVAYYNSGGLSLAEWTQLHFVNDIKREFGEDFIMTSFKGKEEKGVEIIGNNKLHPLWPPESENILSYVYYYYFNGDKIYEFELRIPEDNLSEHEDDLSIVKNSVYFGKPFNLNEWNTYTSEAINFSVKYPKKWKPSEYWEQIGGFVGFDENEKLFEGHKVMISTPGEAEYTSSLAGQVRLENAQVLYPNLEGVPAVRIKGEVSDDYGFWDYTDSVFALVNGVGIEMVYREEGFDLESREYFEQMIRTFRFTD